MIPELDPNDYDQTNQIPEELLSILLIAIPKFEKSRMETIIASASKNYIQGNKIAYDALKKPFKTAEIEDDAYEFLTEYRKQIENGYTIIQGEKVYWLRDRTINERQKIFDIISNGVTQGKAPRKVTKELQDHFGMQKYQAERIARTETAYVQSRGTIDRYKRFGVERVKWLLGKNPCPRCQGLGGRIFEWDKLPGEPPLHPSCTCGLSPSLDPNEKETPYVPKEKPVEKPTDAPDRKTPKREPVKKVPTEPKVKPVKKTPIEKPKVEPKAPVKKEEPIRKPEEVHKIITDHESSIKDKKVEHGAVFSNNGDLLIKKVGEADHITWTREEREVMKSTTLTHTHPNNAGFSQADIKFACGNGLKEIRAVGPTRVYSMHFTDGRDFTPEDWTKLENKFEHNYQMAVAKERLKYKDNPDPNKKWDSDKATEHIANYAWSKTVKEIDGLRYAVGVSK